jgi:predicted nucleic acid-binding protein
MFGGELAVSNSSPLIWQARIGKLTLLKILFGEVNIPRKVHLEITLDKQSADSILIREAMKEGWIKVSEVQIEGAQVLAEVSGMHLGEAEAILLAQELGAELIIDEKEASVTAQMFGVRPIGTIAVLLLALAENQLTISELKDCLDRLVAMGFWLTADVYDKALEEAQSMVKRRK